MTGPTEHTVVLQAASVLLQYPDERVLGHVPRVRALLATLPAGAPVDALRDLADHLSRRDPADLREQYVQTFDRRRRCCLYLTWWTHGETRRRGMALAALKALYRRNGAVLEQAEELPDYLPVVLEFAATVDLAAGLQVLAEHRAGLELLRLALEQLGSPWAAGVRAVCALLPGPSPRDEREARALARSGPPTELVGVPAAADGFDSFVGGPGDRDALDALGVRR